MNYIMAHLNCGFGVFGVYCGALLFLKERSTLGVCVFIAGLLILGTYFLTQYILYTRKEAALFLVNEKIEVLKFSGDETLEHDLCMAIASLQFLIDSQNDIDKYCIESYDETMKTINFIRDSLIFFEEKYRYLQNK